jgi:hypothetical protein
MRADRVGGRTGDLSLFATADLQNRLAVASIPERGRGRPGCAALVALNLGFVDEIVDSRLNP